MGYSALNDAARNDYGLSLLVDDVSEKKRKLGVATIQPMIYAVALILFSFFLFM